MNLIVVPIPAGESVIVVEPGVTPATRLALLISAGGLGLALAGTLVIRIRQGGAV